MAGQYRLKSEKNRSRFYILLSVVFVIAMFKWGVPMMIEAISGPENRRPASEEKDFIPPQQPVLSALPEATNSAKISLEGYTESGALVELLINDETTTSDEADESGLFQFSTTLRLGENRLYVTAKDEAGNSSQSPVSLITYDNNSVSLTMESPVSGTEIFGRANQTIEVKGEVSKWDSQVLVNNSFALVERSGKFSFRLSLSEGENTIRIVATDKAGNRDEEELKVLFNY